MTEWIKGGGRPGRTETLKYVAAAIILVYIILLMSLTSGSTKSFEAVKAQVEASLDTESMEQKNVQGLKRYYGLNSADYDGVMLYMSKSSMSAEEVLLVKTKTDEQAREVKQAVEQRLENRKNDFEGYAPEQVQLLEQAQVSVRGRFVFYAVSPNAKHYEDAFSKSL